MLLPGGPLISHRKRRRPFVKMLACGCKRWRRLQVLLVGLGKEEGMRVQVRRARKIQERKAEKERQRLGKKKGEAGKGKWHAKQGVPRGGGHKPSFARGAQNRGKGRRG